jgi:hypothetical protein
MGCPLRLKPPRLSILGLSMTPAKLLSSLFPQLPHHHRLGQWFTIHVFLLLSIGLIGLSPNATAFDRTVEAQQQQFFESKVRPLLIEHCIRCHGDDKQEGGLRLDSQSGFMRGGEGGPVVDQEDVRNSRLLSAVHYRDLEMPPSGKLADDKIEILELWLESGSYWPEAAQIAIAKGTSPREFSPEDRAYWFFQKLDRAETIESSAVSGRIDHEVEFKLKSNGLSFAEPASPHALVRRL